MQRRLRIAARVALLLGALGCETGGGGRAPGIPEQAGHETPSEAKPGRGSDYLRQVAARDAYGDTYALHWPKRKMPLRIYLPTPEPSLFDDPEAVRETVRDAVLEWTDVAAPGVPSFRFVAEQGDADIPFVFEREPNGGWYVAHCVYQSAPRQLRFGVERILVTGRWADGYVASLTDIHAIVLHEMGHALGLVGHSDDVGDIMYPRVSKNPIPELSQRDRNTLRELYARPSRSIRARRGKPY